MKKKKPLLKKAGSAVFTILCSLIIIFFSWSFIDKITDYNAPVCGYHISVIISSSMSGVNKENQTQLENVTDRYYINDVIFASPVSDSSDLKVNDPILYYRDKNLYSHRIREITTDSAGKTVFKVRGDANAIDDSPDVSFSEIKGKIVGRIPKIGFINRFFSSLYGIIAIFLILFIYFLALILLDKNQRINILTNGLLEENKKK